MTEDVDLRCHAGPDRQDRAVGGPQRCLVRTDTNGEVTAVVSTSTVKADRPNDLGALHALETFDLAVALISADLRLIECAVPSRPIFQSVFRQAGDRVIFCAPATRARFDLVLGRVQAAKTSDGVWISDVFVQPCNAGMPLLIRIMAAPRVHDPAALVVVLDLQRERHVPEYLLKSAFGLTAAEAALASSLTNGRTLREICSASKVRISTLRSHLAGVLAKTGTTRQAHLVSLLARVAVPGLQTPPPSTGGAHAPD